MNYIEINGGNKDQRIFTKQIIEWCIEDLLPRVRTLDITVELLNEECKLKFYSGITPNADGVNDSWEIDNVSLYPENVVNIFDRRGNLVYSGKNYDNKNEVWKGDSKNGKPLPSGTYFFIFESDELTQKGWVELTR